MRAVVFLLISTFLHLGALACLYNRPEPENLPVREIQVSFARISKSHSVQSEEFMHNEVFESESSPRADSTEKKSQKNITADNRQYNSDAIEKLNHEIENSITYPARARQMLQEGRVKLRVYINNNGRAEKVDILESSGFTDLDRAARSAAAAWHYAEGSPGPVELVFEFSLH